MTTKRINNLAIATNCWCTSSAMGATSDNVYGDKLPFSSGVAGWEFVAKRGLGGPEPTPIEDRFWSKVNRESASGCWLWTAATIRGYGQIIGWRQGKKRPLYAHRVAWELANGPIPAHLSVLHKCDVPLCVNPDHLFLGTQADNLIDAREKGRLILAGARAGKLTLEQRIAIYQTPWRKGICAHLAQEFGVSISRIGKIRRGLFARKPRLHERGFQSRDPRPQHAARPVHLSHQSQHVGHTPTVTPAPARA